MRARKELFTCAVYTNGAYFRAKWRLFCLLSFKNFRSTRSFEDLGISLAGEYSTILSVSRERRYMTDSNESG